MLPTVLFSVSTSSCLTSSICDELWRRLLFCESAASTLNCDGMVLIELLSLVWLNMVVELFALLLKSALMMWKLESSWLIILNFSKKPGLGLIISWELLQWVWCASLDDDDLLKKVVMLRVSIAVERVRIVWVLWSTAEGRWGPKQNPLKHNRIQCWCAFYIEYMITPKMTKENSRNYFKDRSLQDN